MKTNNNFQISGFVVNDATINQFAKASVARFGLSVGRLEKNGEKDSRVSAIMNIEAWKSNEASDALNILTKGKRIAVEGYFKPEEYTDKDGVLRFRIGKFKEYPVVQVCKENPSYIKWLFTPNNGDNICTNLTKKAIKTAYYANSNK